LFLAFPSFRFVHPRVSLGEDLFHRLFALRAPVGASHREGHGKTEHPTGFVAPCRLFENSLSNGFGLAARFGQHHKELVPTVPNHDVDLANLAL
jgi:hypothetical protein